MGDQNSFLQELKSGNHKAFIKLVEEYQDMVVKTCFGFVRDWQDAEDIAQDTFIKVFEKIGTFKGESKISSWIYRIAVNLSLNFKRDKKTLNTFELRDANNPNNFPVDVYSLADEHNEADKLILNSDKKQVVKNALKKISKKQRIALILFTQSGLSQKDIAEIMKTSVSAVESLIFRGKITLKKILYEDYSEKNI